jgi:integrase
LRCAANQPSNNIAVFYEKQIALLLEGNGAESFNKHLHPLLRKLGLKRGGMHGFRHHRVNTLVMARAPIEVIKKWIGHGSEEMIRRYTHLRPDVVRDEFARA